MAGAQESLFLDAGAVVLGCSAIAALYFRQAVEPYMDEIFHVPQTIRYCRGDYAFWDPKITTFPGLYIFGAGFARGFHALARLVRPIALDAFCGTTGLRAVNLVFAGLTYATSSALYRQLHPRVTRDYAGLLASLVILFPIHFFFIFLFYTDVGSLLFVLLAHLACLRRAYRGAAAAAAVAVLFRQTNAVWAAFTLAVGILNRTLPAMPAWQAAPLAAQISHVLKETWRLKWELARDMGALAAVPAGFVAFVVRNGGIVVGDKGNHRASLHLMQPLYFVAFAALALPFTHFSPARLGEAAKALERNLRVSRMQTLRRATVVLFFAAYVIQNFTMAHPFLLADNRHYTFYIWKDVLGKYIIVRYTFIPLYIYSTWSLHRSLTAGGATKVWQLGFALCTAATLIPSPLIELRYFLIPFVLLLLHSEPASMPAVVQTLGLYAMTNAATIYVFLFKPFTWPDGSIARFMW